MQEKQKSGTSRTEGKNKYAKKKAGQIRMMTRRQTNKDQGESTHTHTQSCQVISYYEKLVKVKYLMTQK